MQIKPLRPIIIVSICQYFAIGADLCGTKAEVGFALGEFIFVEDELIGTAGNRFAIMLAILRAFFEF